MRGDVVDRPQEQLPRCPAPTGGERWKAFRESVWGLMLIVIVIGGIYSGAFHGDRGRSRRRRLFLHRVRVHLQGHGDEATPKVLLASANLSAMLLYIITNACCSPILMTYENIPQAMASWITDSGFGWISFLLLVNILLLLAGNVMDPSSIILIMAPMLPAAVTLGIHPVHFGILIDVNMEVGLCHPPVGPNLYVAAGIAKMGITELTKAVLPWF